MKKEFENHYVVHQSGGNGWAVVDDPTLDKRFCRLVGVNPKSLGGNNGVQLYLAACDRLTQETILRPDFPRDEMPTSKDYIPRRLPEEAMDDLNEVRTGLANRSISIKHTRIVKN